MKRSCGVALLFLLSVSVRPAGASPVRWDLQDVTFRNCYTYPYNITNQSYTPCTSAGTAQG